MESKFISESLNAVFPSGYFTPETIGGLINQFGEVARDGGNSIQTIYCRQDTADENSRRAAGPNNEQPLTLNDGRLLVVDVYPSTGIYAAVNAGVLSGIQIINNNDLGAFLAQYGPSGSI